MKKLTFTTILLIFAQLILPVQAQIDAGFGNEGGNGGNDEITELKLDFAAAAERIQYKINHELRLSRQLQAAGLDPQLFWTSEQSAQVLYFLVFADVEYPAPQTLIIDFNEWAKYSVMMSSAEYFVLEKLARHYELQTDALNELMRTYQGI